MEWYQGSIPAAIQETKASGKLLIVYLHDASEHGQKMTSLLDSDATIAARLHAGNCVALKLESGTEAFGQFSAFYPVIILPSTYFIGNNGTPLEVVGGFVETEPFLQRADNAFKLHNSSTEVMAASNQTETDSIAETTEPTATASSALPTEESQTTAPLEDRMAAARDKIEEQKRERVQKENEEHKLREIERRKLGQEMAKAQQQKEEEAIRRRAEEMAKEKADQKRARENIKQQIEKDRQERQAKFEEEKRQKEQKTQQKLEEKQAADAAAAAELQARIRSSSRLQFRLPDGSAIIQEFPVDATFQQVKQFIQEAASARGLPEFDLIHSLSRRRFQPDDDSATLSALDLAGPNALIVVPRTSKGVKTSGDADGTVSGFDLVALFWMLLAPFIFLFNLIRNFVVGTQSASDVGRTPLMVSPSGINNARTDRSNTDVRQRPSGTSYSRDGNVHRLRRPDSESDSDDPTWNGNSTQQL